MDNQNQSNQEPANTSSLPQNDPPNINSNPQIQSSSQPTVLVPEQILTGTEKLKRSFFQILIGCLIGAASIAVFAVLIGTFNDILSKSLGTIVMVAIHAILSLGYISESEKRDKKDGGRSIELFSNTVFVLITLSFFTSVFAIWQLIDPAFAFKLYLLYGVLLFATFHADILYRIRQFDNKIDSVVTVNYFLMTMVVVMLSVLIFTNDIVDLGEPFYRILAALGIIDATLTITAIIMHKLFLQKHPELAPSNEELNSAKSKSFWKNPLVVLLLIFLGFQVLGSIIALFIAGF